MRLAGTCSRYSNNAIPQLTSAATTHGRPECFFRCAYQANVMNTFDSVNKPIAAAAGGKFGSIGISYNAAMPDHDIRVPFQAHVDLLQLFIAQRTQVVERIRGVLSAEQK